MNWFEKTFVFNEGNRFKPVLWKRMRDAIFIIWDQSDREFDCFFCYLNGINPQIQFTIEKENDGNLSFLDIDIWRKKDNLITKVYRKPTHTQKYIHWRSNHPKTYFWEFLRVSSIESIVLKIYWMNWIF
jgi:hypothetical protein